MNGNVGAQVTALTDKIAALQNPDAYPESPSMVEAVETHKSWVFLTDRYAYKLKKPIQFNDVDLRSLSTRYANSLEEVRLNRRLAADVYLGVVPLTKDRQDRIRIAGEGEAIDWLVKMRRLPAGLMLDRMLAEDRAERDEILTVATLLAEFYRDASPAGVSADEYRDGIDRELSQSCAAFTRETGHMIGVDGAPAVVSLMAFLDRWPDIFNQRVLNGRIVDGHGDLRAEHICVIDPRPVVIDCLEFDRRLRIVDPLDELGFLALECERHGASWVGPILMEAYLSVTGDRAPELLINFYKAYRATTWARLAVWRLHEAADQNQGKWANRARDYLLLANHYVRELAAI